MLPATSFIKAQESCFSIDIVEKHLNISRENFTINSSKMTSATEQNFISDVYRLEFEVEIHGDGNRIISVIMKVSENVTNEIKQLSVFAREQLVYDDMIISFENIWTEIGKKILFSPKCYKVTKIPYEMIVLEDLKADGYEMASKQLGLNLQQTKVVLSKLAKLHAASAVRYVKVCTQLNKY